MSSEKAQISIAQRFYELPLVILIGYVCFILIDALYLKSNNLELQLIGGAFISAIIWGAKHYFIG